MLDFIGTIVLVAAVITSINALTGAMPISSSQRLAVSAGAGLWTGLAAALGAANLFVGTNPIGPGVIGTVSYRWAGGTHDAPYTTPTPHVLHETFAKMKAAGCSHVVMEVSSAALAMDRLAGVKFAVLGPAVRAALIPPAIVTRS